MSEGQNAYRPTGATQVDQSGKTKYVLQAFSARTIYFCDNKDWAKDTEGKVYCYVYTKGEPDEQYKPWPGELMVYSHQDPLLNKAVYKYVLSDEYDYAVIRKYSDGTQTVDIALQGHNAFSIEGDDAIASGDDAGKWDVTAWDYPAVVQPTKTPHHLEVSYGGDTTLSVGGAIEYDQLTVILVYAEEDREPDTIDVEQCEIAYDFSTPGDRVLTVTYAGVSGTCDFTIEDESDGMRTIYFFNNGNGGGSWTDVYAHSYSEDRTIATIWPGKQCTHLGDDVYEVEIDAACDYIIFNNGNEGGGDNQTVAIALDENSSGYTFGDTKDGLDNWTVVSWVYEA